MSDGKRYAALAAAEADVRDMVAEVARLRAELAESQRLERHHSGWAERAEAARDAALRERDEARQELIDVRAELDVRRADVAGRMTEAEHRSRQWAAESAALAKRLEDVTGALADARAALEHIRISEMGPRFMQEIARAALAASGPASGEGTR